jgi:hypothetical protein
MSLKLYFHPLSSFCHKALIALYEKDTEFQPIFVDLLDAASRAALSAVWPMANVTPQALLIVVASPAKADRPVTEAERVRLLAALAAEGCTGGKMEWMKNDREFEVDDARCADGREYDLKFDANFRLIK